MRVIKPCILDDHYHAATPEGKVLVSHLMYEGCTLDLGGRELKTNLVQLNIGEFDIILGMDWLSQNYAHIDCKSKSVYFQTPNTPPFSFQGFEENQRRSLYPFYLPYKLGEQLGRDVTVFDLYSRL